MKAEYFNGRWDSWPKNHKGKVLLLAINVEKIRQAQNTFPQAEIIVMANETLPEKQARLKAAACIWAESLYAYKLICRAIGITEETMIQWRKKDTEFSDNLEMSRVKFLNRNMRKAKPEFLLERLELEHFKQRTESDLYVKELPKPILQLPEKKDDVDKSS